MSESGDIVLWAVERLIPYDRNVKTHSDDQVAKIAASIKKFGWRGNPIVVNEKGVIIAGHGRRLAALKLGMPQVPVQVATGLTEEDERALRLADNRVAQGDIDTTLLREEVIDLKGYDLSDIFDQKEIDFLSADLSSMTDLAPTDLSAEIKKSEAEAAEIVREVDAKPIRVDYALGFKTIPAEKQRLVARFMAEIEARFKLDPTNSFLAFIEASLKEPA